MPHARLADLRKNVLSRTSLGAAHEPHWWYQPPWGSNWGMDRPGGARGKYAGPRLELSVHSRGAHETASPELWASAATP
jgi:hypothetical protein